MFNLYFAGKYIKEFDSFIIENNGNRLYSQVNDRSQIRSWDTSNTDSKSKLFIDSGAFTVYTQQISLNVDDYVDYLVSLKDKPYIYAALDKIPGTINNPVTNAQRNEAAEVTWNNYLTMLDKLEKSKLLPTFHINEDFKYLKRMLETKIDGEYIDYIGIGGIAKKTEFERISWLDDVFEFVRNSKNSNVKIHGFGMTSYKLLEKYKFHSADSTGWLMTTAHGNIYTKNGSVCISDVKLNEKNHILNQNNDRKKYIRDYVENIGFTLEELSEDYKKRAKFNILFILNWCNNYKFTGKLYSRRLF